MKFLEKKKSTLIEVTHQIGLDYEILNSVTYWFAAELLYVSSFPSLLKYTLAFAHFFLRLWMESKPPQQQIKIQPVNCGWVYFNKKCGEWTSECSLEGLNPHQNAWVNLNGAFIAAHWISSGLFVRLGMVRF